MSQSIYNITDWTDGETIVTWDIRKDQSYYWYATQDHTAAVATNRPSLTSTFWDGNTTILGVTKPRFFFTPNYNPSIVSAPKVNAIAFGDSYEQRVVTEINNDLLRLDLTFEKRPIAEITAILHFLHQRKGREAFVYTPPKPYNTAKLFKAESWNVVQPFHNNYGLRVQFVETVS